MIAIKKQLPSNASGYFLLGAIWLFLGFAFGAAILLGPLRLWVNFIRDNKFSSATENAGVVLMMTLLVLLSFLFSLKLFQWQRLSDHSWAAFAVIGFPALAAGIAIWLFMNPDIINNTEANENVSAKFTLGSYPTADKIEELKKQGYTCIISLLHPAVVPFEPKLMKEEEEATSKAGIQLIEAPMLPWIGDNDASLKKIEDIIKTGKGKYYVHCYLGKDRVNVVKNLITKLTGSVSNENPESARTFESQRSFERGDIYRLDSAVYMTPYPTDEEFLSFFQAGNIRSVINIMDSTQEDAKPWIAKETKALQTNGTHFIQIPVNESSTEKDMLPILRAIDSLPKPLVIHQWNTSNDQCKLFRKSYFNKTKVVQLNLATRNEESY